MDESRTFCVKNEEKNQFILPPSSFRSWVTRSRLIEIFGGYLLGRRSPNCPLSPCWGTKSFPHKTGRAIAGTKRKAVAFLAHFVFGTTEYFLIPNL
jgi:hypothetical protein